MDAVNVRAPEHGDHVEVRYWDTGSGDGWVPAVVTFVARVDAHGQACPAWIVSASGRRPDGSICGPHVTGFWGNSVRAVGAP
jgi:hypothetical protein